MSEPTRVAVVRPKVGWEEVLGYLIAGVGVTAVTGWILMLIVGAITPWNLSYWHTVLALIALRSVQVGSGWMRWTHPYKKRSGR